MKSNDFLSERQAGPGMTPEFLLVISCLFSVCITIVRVLYTHQLMFVWLQWNLFLAVIPYLITRYMKRNPGLVHKRWKFWMISFVWLIFIPNAFYILTDLFHLRERHGIPLWFDLVLILSYAWNGLILGIISVWQMEKLVQARLKLRHEIFFVLPVMFLNGLGVYTGRILRYNSWDILSDPHSLFTDFIYLLGHPIRNRVDWTMIISFSIFLTLIYLLIKFAGRIAHPVNGSKTDSRLVT